MKTRLAEAINEPRLPRDAESGNTDDYRVWDVVLDGTIIGTVHGATEVEASEVVAPFGLNLKVVSRRP